MIKNIIFDLGNVILKDNPNIILNTLGLDKDEIETIDNKFFKNWKELDLGRITLKQHFENCKFNFEINTETEEKLVHYYKYRPFNNELLELIKQLKAENYKIYILSNNNIDAKKYLINLPFFKNFDGYVFSCDYNILKPDLEIYNILFKKYSLIPNECFFIDDKKHNIKAGETLGMKGFTFNYKENGISNLVKILHKNNVL